MKTSFSVTDLHAKLDQLQVTLRSRENTLLADMTKRLNELQKEVSATLTKSEQNFKINNNATVIAPKDSVGQAKLSNSNIGLGMSYPDPCGIPATLTTENNKTNTSVVIVGPNRDIGQCLGQFQATSNSNSTTKPAALVRTHYVNWDHNKHEQLKYLRLVNYKDLRDIIEKYTFKGLITPPVDLTLEEVVRARREITALHVWTVTKYKRFPSTGDFIDINLTSEKNTQLKKMLTTMHLVTFEEAARIYAYENIFRGDNAMDQCVFEIRHGLQWSLDRYTLY